MAHLTLNKVTIEFPLLHVGHRSLKKTLVSRVTGGRILKEANAPHIVRALSNISLDIGAGDRIGLIGPNGAGKTTLLRTMAGIYEPVAGSMDGSGKIATLLDISAGMNPELTGWENIELRGLFMGLSHQEISALAPGIEEFTELGDFLNVPIRTYSAGMMLRLSFALATSIAPDILLMDEWLMAGDAGFAAKASARLQHVVNSANILVLASHSNATIAKWCSKVAYLQQGRLVAFGRADEVLKSYELASGA